MAAATILMAILGCGDAGDACQQVAVVPVRYESVSACVAAQDDVLARADIMYPVVTAQCRADKVVPVSLSPKADKVAPARTRTAIRVALRG